MRPAITFFNIQLSNSRKYAKIGRRLDKLIQKTLDDSKTV